MNTDYAQNIKDDRDKFDANRVVSEPTLTAYQRKMAYGSHAAPFVTFLCISNAMIYAARKNLLNSRNFVILTVIGSFPLAIIASKYLFGYDKLRRISQIDYDTYNSAKYYEKETSSSQ